MIYRKVVKTRDGFARQQPIDGTALIHADTDNAEDGAFLVQFESNGMTMATWLDRESTTNYRDALTAALVSTEPR
jgi:hypothetical protein